MVHTLIELGGAYREGTLNKHSGIFSEKQTGVLVAQFSSVLNIDHTATDIDTVCTRVVFK